MPILLYDIKRQHELGPEQGSISEELLEQIQLSCPYQILLDKSHLYLRLRREYIRVGLLMVIKDMVK
jgi:hypothetical protein